MNRVHRFEARLRSPQDGVRLRLLHELTHFVPRDAQAYPTYFRFLLDDPAPRIRWEAAWRLAYQLGPTKAVPHARWDVPMHGLVDANSEGSLARLRSQTRSGNRRALVWGVEALGLIADAPSAGLFEAHLEDRTPTMRLRAALAAVRVGLDEVPEELEPGLHTLRHLARTRPAERAPMVPVLAAEALVRAGERSALLLLVEQAQAFDFAPLSFGPEQILEDLTGVFRDTPEAWANHIERTVGRPEAQRLP